MSPIAIFGLPGSGKASLREGLRQVLPESYCLFDFYEQLQESTDGPQSFYDTTLHQQSLVRKSTLKDIIDKCAEDDKTCIIFAEYARWDKELQSIRAANWSTAEPSPERYHDIFSLVIYLDTPPETIHDRMARKPKHRDLQLPLQQIRQWQTEEKALLHRQRYEDDHSFVSCRNYDRAEGPKMCADLINRFLDGSDVWNSNANLEVVYSRVDALVAVETCLLETMVILSLDSLLGPFGSSAAFWDGHNVVYDRVKDLGPVPVGDLSRQIVLWYDEYRDVDLKDDFEERCVRVGAIESARLNPALFAFLMTLEDHEHVGAVLVTCGLQRLWEEVLRSAGVPSKIKVIGSSRFKDLGMDDKGHVVSAYDKEGLVNHFKDRYGLHTVVLANSPVDICMLEAADEAFILVDKEVSRNAAMAEDVRISPISRQGADLVGAKQVLLGDCEPLLEEAKLPITNFSSPELTTDLLKRRITMFHATDINGGKSLVEVLREPIDRVGSELVGHHLAYEYVAKHLVGFEPDPMMPTTSRLRDERKILIVALEPHGKGIACGVRRVFSRAGYLSARSHEDVPRARVDAASTVIIVDAEIGSGLSMAQFVSHVADSPSVARIVVLTDVLQEIAIRPGQPFRTMVQQCGIAMVALRLSYTKASMRAWNFVGSTSAENAPLGSDK